MAENVPSGGHDLRCALEADFPSQVGRDWWDDEFFLGLMRIRGVECRSPYAEGFFSSKVVLDVTGPGSAR